MYYWDDTVKRYRDERGRFVSREVVLDYLRKSIDSTNNVSDLLAELVSTDRIAPKDWYSLMKEEIKREYIRDFILGIGGLAVMTFALWGMIGNMLREQYQYLKGFLSEIIAGNLSAAQIAARAKMYFEAAREAFWTATSRNAKAWGAVEERWLVNPMVENCIDCLGYQDEGWKPFGYFPQPGSGASRCLSRCRCVKEYRNAKGEVYYA